MIVALVLVLWRPSWVSPGTVADGEAAAAPDKWRAERNAEASAQAARSLRVSSSQKPKITLQAVFQAENFDPAALLDHEVVERFLDQRGRDAEGCLAAWSTTRNPDYLDEAARRSPRDPAVLLALATQGKDPETRKQAADALRRFAPQVPEGDLIAASGAFDEGRFDEGLALLQAAIAKMPSTTTGTRAKSSQNTKVALFEEAGCEPPVARILAAFSPDLRPIGCLSKIAKQVGVLEQQALANGDPQRALELANMTIRVAANEQTPGCILITSVISNRLEKRALSALPATMPLRPDGPTAGSRLGQLDGQFQEIMQLVTMSTSLKSLSPALLEEYANRFVTEGELSALRWAADQLPPP